MFTLGGGGDDVHSHAVVPRGVRGGGFSDERGERPDGVVGGCGGGGERGGGGVVAVAFGGGDDSLGGVSAVERGGGCVRGDAELSRGDLVSVSRAEP